MADAISDASAPSRSAVVDAIGSRMPAIPHMLAQPSSRHMALRRRWVHVDAPGRDDGQPITSRTRDASGDTGRSGISRTGILVSLRMLSDRSTVVLIFSEPSTVAIPEAVQNGPSLLVPRGLLQMPGGVRQVPEVPRRASVTPRQENGIPGVVVRPPRFAFVGRTVRAESADTALGRLLIGHGPSRHGVDQHVEATLPDPTVEVEVLESEEP